MSTYDQHIFLCVSLVICPSHVAAGCCSYGKALLNALAGFCCHLAHIFEFLEKKNHVTLLHEHAV
jgi:hypothetical protein